jgi:hypothetical protein
LLLTAAQRLFIEDEFLPESILLRDPSKLTRSQTDPLLHHWRQRQEDDTIGTFRFKCVTVGRGKEMVDAQYPAVPEEPDVQPRPRARKARRKGRVSRPRKRKVVVPQDPEFSDTPTIEGSDTLQASPVGRRRSKRANAPDESDESDADDQPRSPSPQRGRPRTRATLGSRHPLPDATASPPAREQDRGDMVSGHC